MIMKKINKARVRGKTFTVWEGATEDQIVKMLNSFGTGGIVVCPVCRRVDIDPYIHFDKCDPIFEAYRRESQDNAWK
jgi:hypothetical protein